MLLKIIGKERSVLLKEENVDLNVDTIRDRVQKLSELFFKLREIT